MDRPLPGHRRQVRTQRRHSSTRHAHRARGPRGRLRVFCGDLRRQRSRLHRLARGTTRTVEPVAKLLLATSCLPPLACQNLLVSQYVGVTRLTYADLYMTVTGAAYLLGLRARRAATLAYMHLPRLPMAPLRQPLHHEGVLYHLSKRRSISTPRSLARLARLESAEGVKSF